ncbi:MAG: ATP-dependent RNA helicase DbpA [Gammaproteobacteria bacterium]|jgi:ATP-independent RNA helicase DbpA|nr:ATP-dependent RNA helicase DbpA [Gammaproteobacteria bacterium]MBT6041900.1 ATP-dependent RNA helicase DbpA [Gammaproteobacteria bacterium]
MTSTAFSSLSLSPEFLANLESLQYKEMTPIQAQSLPVIFEGKDVKAQAKTGSGKTAAFGIGLLNKLRPQDFITQALVLCPTRELADQVSKELRRLARPITNIKILTLCGGTPIGPQFGSLEQHSPHVVVGTPGRILKHCQKEKLNLDDVVTLVLDEADRMLDMGFLEDISAIINYTPKQRQTLLFSATYPEEIQHISENVQISPVTIQVESRHDDSVIRQQFYEVDRGHKTEALISLLKKYQPESCVVFCQRKQQCQELADELRQKGFHALALHGDLEQKERDRVLVRFSNKSIQVLIATDVAARGLDIKDLAVVVNYEISPDPEIYIHRIGRTGRAGKEGLALSLFLASEIRKVQAIEAYLEKPLLFKSIPPSTDSQTPKPGMVTLIIDSGRKNKMRAGDILGALTANKVIAGNQIGKIDIFDFVSYVAVEREIAKGALAILSEGKIKGRKVHVRRM